MNVDQQQALLERACNGDVQALGDLLQSFRPYVRVIVHALAQQWRQGIIDDSDLIQDSLLEAQKSFTRFRGKNRNHLRAWLRQIAVWTAGRTLRALSAEAMAQVDGVTDSLIDCGSSPSEQVLRQERAQQVADTLARLPEDMQQVLQGRHVDGLEHAEIARQMGRSPEAVRTLYVRSLRRLREMLNKEI